MVYKKFIAMVFGNHKKSGLSVIAIFFNMRREAMRTLHSLSRCAAA